MGIQRESSIKRDVIASPIAPEATRHWRSKGEGIRASFGERVIAKLRNECQSVTSKRHSRVPCGAGPEFHVIPAGTVAISPVTDNEFYTVCAQHHGEGRGRIRHRARKDRIVVRPLLGWHI